MSIAVQEYRSTSRLCSSWALALLAGFLLATSVAGQVRSEDPGGTKTEKQQEEPQPEVKQDDLERAVEFFITATRLEEDLTSVPASVNVVGRDAIRSRALVSVLDALDESIGVWVEKRTGTTSDIVLRGLSGGNILALVDGNTLSTYWGEGGFAGDDLYGKVDAETIERIEVVRGPASLRYGANALGGVVNFITRGSPFEFNEGELKVGGRLAGYYGSAADEFGLRAESWGVLGDFRWLVGTSYREVGDTRSAERKQVPTSGEEFNGDAKFEFRVGREEYLTITVQDVNRDHLHRFYRPTQDNFNDRTGVAVFYDAADLDFWWADRLSVKVYYQAKKDIRRFFDGPVGDSASSITAIGVAKWDTFQTSAVFEKDIDPFRISWGLDYEVTWGESPDDEQFTIHPKDGSAVTKPAPDSVWQGLGFFATAEWFVNDWFEVHGGIRLQAYAFSTHVDSRFVDPGGQPQLAEIDEDEFSVTGSLSLLFHPDENTDLWLSYTRGFRQFAPNFGIVKLGFGVLVPNGFLDPVVSHSFELGFRTDQRSWGAEGAVYYSDFDDFQNRVSGTFQGSAFYDFNGDGILDPDEAVIKTSADGDAYLWGVELALWMRPHELIWSAIPEGFTCGVGFMYNYGQDTTNDEPLRHTHPMRALFKVRYDDPDDRFYAEIVADVVGRFDRVPPGRLTSDPGYRSNPQDPTSPLIRSYGLPGYTVFDFRAGYRICDNARIDLGVENFTDKQYRTAHSRWDAAGINVHVGLEITF